jgi:hypothetical protein
LAIYARSVTVRGLFAAFREPEIAHRTVGLFTLRRIVCAVSSPPKARHYASINQ